MEGNAGSKPSGYKTILVAFDGSEGSNDALRRALLIAGEQGARVTVLSVDEDIPRYAPGVGEVEEESELRSEQFQQLKEQALQVAAEYGASISVDTRVGHAAQSILEAATEGHFDLVVMGQRGHSGLWGALIGSATDRVVDHAPCDVLVVR